MVSLLVKIIETKMLTRLIIIISILLQQILQFIIRVLLVKLLFIIIYWALVQSLLNLQILQHLMAQNKYLLMVMMCIIPLLPHYLR